jgi:hypothetical protein
MLPGQKGFSEPFIGDPVLLQFALTCYSKNPYGQPFSIFEDIIKINILNAILKLVLDLCHQFLDLFL